jgi:hypothetical protein
MRELLDRLNAVDSGADAPTTSAIDQAADLFHAASQAINEAIEAVRAPGMPLDIVGRWTRQMPLQALAVAFLIGVMTVRRR